MLLKLLNVLVLHNMNDYALGTVLIVTCIIFCCALVSDLRHQRIPNQLCLLALILGISLQTVFGQWQGLVTAFYGAGLALVLLLPTFYFRILGAGDVKLMVGVGALLGPKLLLWSLAYGIIFGAITSVLLATVKVGWSGIKATAIRYYHCIVLRQYFTPDNNEAAAQRVPYAPALALGWLWACYFDPQVSTLYAALSFQIRSWIYL